MWWWVATAWAVPPDFWATWGDGRAELAGYDLVVPRYGELRRGEMVTVTVTETMTRAARVKSDGGHPDEFPVVKLQTMLDFQTGVYDYDTTTSAFVSLEDGAAWGVPTKLAVSVAEWCGVMGGVWRFDGPVSTVTSHSYFDGEGDEERVLPVPPRALVGDLLPWLVRGIAQPLVEGEHPYLARWVDLRFRHEDPKWGRAEVRRGGAAEVEVGGQRLAGHVVEVAVHGGPTDRFVVEDAAPHRLLLWSRDDGFEARLTGSMRDAYWQHHAEGDEALRAGLGLRPDPWHPR